jgi:hypothetical protein
VDTAGFAKLLTQTGLRDTNDKHMNVFVAPPASPDAPPPHPIGTPAQFGNRIAVSNAYGVCRATSVIRICVTATTPRRASRSPRIPAKPPSSAPGSPSTSRTVAR